VRQFIELEIFFEAFERGAAGELPAAGDVNALGDAARDHPALQTVAGERRRALRYPTNATTSGCVALNEQNESA
jgi:hypothetical protein